ncbi:uncharacterized protein LOC127441571 isoform X2 [Myxocyprinus asiaticus]|uniref:uncharacterized protein LOC127441571 isoform X2 n=1 Tax=Myxocyprinus asiaticus TaxID=70543 RepID=UPI002223D63C|nr:uncharacterized protein LOC127441571 isoform X2 [Myxocyprinus asiaticus]
MKSGLISLCLKCAYKTNRQLKPRKITLSVETVRRRTQPNHLASEEGGESRACTTDWFSIVKKEPPYLTQNRLSFFFSPGEKSKFVCENTVTSGGGTDWVDTGGGGGNLREPGPLNYLHKHCERDKQSYLQVPVPPLVYYLSIIQVPSPVGK